MKKVPKSFMINHQQRSKIQRSDSFLVGALLALTGGFLDAYSYLTRGGVFANAQTGNMVLLGLRLSEHRWNEALTYLLPILAFAMGVLLAEWMKSVFQHKRLFHWRQLVLAIECVLLFVIGFIPSGDWNPYVNIMISFVCALQVDSFRTMHGLSYATTMCTGNLRSGTELLFRAMREKDADQFRNAMKYFSIIIVFILGAAAGFFSADSFGVRSIWIPLAILALVFLLLWRNAASESDASNSFEA